MVDATVHYRGQPAAERAYSALPRVGDLLDVDGALWRVSYLVYGPTVDVYAVRAADDVGAELAAWADAPAAEEPAEPQQRGLFE